MFARIACAPGWHATNSAGGVDRPSVSACEPDDEVDDLEGFGRSPCSCNCAELEDISSGRECAHPRLAEWGPDMKTTTDPRPARSAGPGCFDAAQEPLMRALRCDETETTGNYEHRTDRRGGLSLRSDGTVRAEVVRKTE